MEDELSPVWEYRDFLYRISHCDDCDCAHDDPSPMCECICHERNAA